MRCGVISVLQCDAVPVACAVHFWWGHCLGAVLSEVRVCLIGWLSACTTFWGSTYHVQWVCGWKGGCVLGNQQCISRVACLCIVALCSVVGWQCLHCSCFHSRGYVLNMNMDLVVLGWYGCHGCIYTAQAWIGVFSCV